jgi:hypothetical protein
MSATRVQRVGAASVNVLQNKQFLGTGNHDILIYGLTLDGNRFAGGGGHVIRFTNVQTGTVQQVQLARGAYTNFSVQGNGVAQGSNHNITIRDSQVVDSGDSGMDIEDVIGFKVDNNTVTNNAQAGINVEPSRDTEEVQSGTISNNRVSAPSPVTTSTSNARYGIDLNGWSFATYSDPIQNVSVVNNQVSYQEKGIIANGSNISGITISGNTVSNTGQQGVLIGTATPITQHVTASNNTVQNVSQDVARAYAAIELQAADFCTVQYNTISQTSGAYAAPIAQTDGSANNTINNNTVT